MRKKILVSFCVLLAIGAIAGLARNQIARIGLQLGVRHLTGFPLTIGSVNVKLWDGQLDARDVKLMNPRGFAEPLFAELPQLRIQYQPRSILAFAPHIPDMLVDINRLVIVRTASGDSNAMKLKGVLSSRKSNTKYQIDQLHIHVGTVIIKDFSRAGTLETVKPLNIKATYKDITDSTDVTRLVLLTVLNRSRLPQIGLSPADLAKNLGDVHGLTEDIVKDAAGRLIDTLKPAPGK